MTDVVFDNGYEAEAWREIRDWEQRPDAKLTSLTKVVSRPMGRVADTVLKLPPVARSTDKLGDSLRTATSTVAGTVDVPQVLRSSASALGRPVRQLEELRAVDLRSLDRQAQGIDKRYIALASATGGAAGATSSLPGGTLLALSALGADVVATTVALLRAISTYGTTYGRDMKAPEEAQFAVGLLSLGAVAGEAKGRADMLVHLHAVSAMLAGGATWEQLSRQPSGKALQGFFDTLGVRLTRRKLTQVVPFLGIAAGGTLGAALADGTCQGAYMQYRRRYLIDKYPGLLDQPRLRR